MYLRYGRWTSALNEAAVTFQKTAVRAFSGAVAYYEETWTITGSQPDENRLVFALLLLR